nr:hypothetical protein [Thermus thermophilus]
MKRIWIGLLLVLLAFGFAQKRVVLGVGGKTAVVYLPLTVVERLGYFKDEGLDVVIQDLQAGSRALQALVGGAWRWSWASTTTPSRCRPRAGTSWPSWRWGATRPSSSGCGPTWRTR